MLEVEQQQGQQILAELVNAYDAQQDINIATQAYLRKLALCSICCSDLPIGDYLFTLYEKNFKLNSVLRHVKYYISYWDMLIKNIEIFDFPLKDKIIEGIDRKVKIYLDNYIKDQLDPEVISFPSLIENVLSLIKEGIEPDVIIPLYKKYIDRNINFENVIPVNANEFITRSFHYHINQQSHNNDFNVEIVQNLNFVKISFLQILKNANINFNEANITQYTNDEGSSVEESSSDDIFEDSSDDDVFAEDRFLGDIDDDGYVVEQNGVQKSDNERILGECKQVKITQTTPTLWRSHSTGHLLASTSNFTNNESKYYHPTV